MGWERGCRAIEREHGDAGVWGWRCACVMEMESQMDMVVYRAVEGAVRDRVTVSEVCA